jgi:hypothetical protein
MILYHNISQPCISRQGKMHRFFGAEKSSAFWTIPSISPGHPQASQRRGVAVRWILQGFHVFFGDGYT